MIPLVVLRLEGPFQAWGTFRSRWYYRDTGTEPTKSAIVGLLGCALGIKRFSPELEELDKNIKICVRVEHPGVKQIEFQTISSGYISANRSIQTDSIVITKEYLNDASFLTVISAERSLLKKFEQALKRPAWSIFLGRKACVPSYPVFDSFTEEYDSMENAIRKILWRYEYAKKVPEKLRCVVENDSDYDKIVYDAVRNNFSRSYSVRKIKEFWVEPILQKEV